MSEAESFPSSEPRSTLPPFIVEAYDHLGQRAGLSELALGESITLRRRLHLLKIELQKLRWQRDRNDKGAQAAFEELRHELERERFEQIEQPLKSLQENVARLEHEVAAEKSRFGPDPQSKPKDRLSPEEQCILRAVLIRIGFLSPDEDLPVLDRFYTGVAGKSRVFQLYLKNTRTGLIAKFDEPDRAQREWRVIHTLRVLNVPPETILPLSRNMDSDGVIVYRVAGTHRLKRSATLATFLVDQLLVANKNCTRCTELFLEPLRYFYDIEPGQILDRSTDGTLHEWRHFFPRLLDGAPLRELAQRVWADIDWSQEPLCSVDESSAIGRSLSGRPNPIVWLPKLLSQPTGDVRLSRVHGDLNLTNVLICPDQKGTPVKANVIDLAESKSWCPTACDLARFEAQFWLEVYPRLLQSKKLSEIDRLEDFAAICDYLAGRSESSANVRTEAGTAAMNFVKHLRQQAYDILSPGSASGYVLGDYFHALFFNFLRPLRYPKVQEEPELVRLLLLGAACALHTIQDVSRGAYSPGAQRALKLPHRGVSDGEPVA